MVSVYAIVVAGVALQRLLELGLARRNGAWARARGAVEFGRGHYPFMVALHTAFLAGCVLEVAILERPFHPAQGIAMLALLGVAQVLRRASIRTLGRRWNTRVLVLPGEPLVEAGPYRFVRHPNYVAVALEGVALPLLHGAWVTALVFSLLNTPLLAVRIRCEERALETYGPGAAQLGRRPRFVPTRTHLEEA